MTSCPLKTSLLVVPASLGSFRQMSSKLNGELRKFFLLSSIWSSDVQSDVPSSRSPKSSAISRIRSLAVRRLTRSSARASSLIALNDGRRLTGVSASEPPSMDPYLWILTRSKALTSLPPTGSVPWWL